jgi:hypothetical protein
MSWDRIARRVVRNLCVSVAAWSALCAAASADVVWNLDPTQSSLTLSIPPVIEPGQGNLGDADYRPAVTVVGTAQTDPGTSGDPSLAAPLNSLTTKLGGSLKTYGASFLTNINLGGVAGNASQLSIHALTTGNWLPDQTGGIREANGQATYGAPSPANLAFTLTRTSPLGGPLTVPPYDASLLTTDIGRGVMTDVAGLLSTRNFTVPVSNGQFDTFWLTLSSGFGVRVNLAEPINGLEYGPGALTQAEEIAIFGSPGTTFNRLLAISDPGTISRAGAAYVLDIPFAGHENTFFVPLDVIMHVRAVANLRVGDVNFDGAVNSADKLLVQSHLGETDPRGLGLGDANGDGVVNSADLALVPEPATMVSLACGVAILTIAGQMKKRRR